MAISSGRPGGLTTMAVMNFVFAGWGMLSLVGVVFLLLMPNNPAREKLTVPVILTSASMTLVAAVLLLMSGIGYIRQSRTLGWLLGLGYGTFGILQQVVELLILKQEIGIGHVVGALYPLETLFFLLLVFRKDFGTSG